MANVYRITTKSLWSTIDIQNTFHYVVRTGPGGASSAASLLAKFDSSVRSKYLAVMGNDSTLLEIDCTQEMAPGDHTPPDFATISPNVPGTRVSVDHFTPPQLCALAKFPSNAAVKGGHGRAFLPPNQNSGALATNGLWKTTDAYWTACVALATELKNGFSSGSWWTAGWDANMVVYSRTRRARGDANYYFDVIDAKIDPLQHWLRSRAK